MEKIRFANGVEYDCPAVYADTAGNAFVILPSVTFVEAAQIASSADTLQSFEWSGRTYIGYTHCRAIAENPQGIQLVLMGGHYE